MQDSPVCIPETAVLHIPQAPQSGGKRRPGSLRLRPFFPVCGQNIGRNIAFIRNFWYFCGSKALM